MLGRLRKQHRGLARTVLALFIAGFVSLSIQPCLMAATLNDCHVASMQSPTANPLQDHSGDLDANCAHCRYDDPVVEAPDTSSMYSCASMAACSDDVQPSIVNAAELNLKPSAACISSAPRISAEPTVHPPRVQSAIGAPSPSLNIHYCRFLI